MGVKLEKWRDADRLAHAAEMWLRGFSRRHDCEVPAADAEAARQLRDVADRLFEAAMAELQGEIGGALNAACQSSGRARQ